MVFNTSKNEKGFALLLAVVVSGVILSIGLTMLTITIKQLTLSSVSRESEIAFQASQAGLECIRYHKQKDNANNFFNEVTSLGSAPTITCFSQTSQAGDTEDQLENSNPDGYTNVFKYSFDRPVDPISSKTQCIEIELYVMYGENADYTYNFSTIPAIGSKTCNHLDVCTIAVSQGYNRSCNDLSNGLVTVQRELTAQF